MIVEVRPSHLVVKLGPQFHDNYIIPKTAIANPGLYTAGDQDFNIRISEDIAKKLGII